MAHSQLDARIENRKMEADRQAKATPFNGRPPVEVLDVSQGWDSLAKLDVVIRRLKQLEMHNERLVFCPARWEEIEQLGFTVEDDDERHIQGATEAYIRDPNGRNFASEMCELSDSPALIVFQADMLDGFEGRYYPVGDLRDAANMIFLLTSDDFR